MAVTATFEATSIGTAICAGKDVTVANIEMSPLAFRSADHALEMPVASGTIRVVVTPANAHLFAPGRKWTVEIKPAGGV